MPVALIIGVSGQDGAYLSQWLLRRGYHVHGTSRDPAAADLSGLRRLGLDGKLTLHALDPLVMDQVASVFESVNADEIYNLSGQSSVGMSFQRPLETFNSIATATLVMLEALRQGKRPRRFLNACSGDIFGETAMPATETSPFDLRSPYAVAKASAYWAVRNYRETHGLPACSAFLFNHESPLRKEQFVTAKIVAAAVRIARGSGETLSLGNIAVRRDWGWAPDYVEAMQAMLQHEIPRDMVIATGVPHSLTDFIAQVFAALGLDWQDHVHQAEMHFRPNDVVLNYGDPALARQLLGWQPKTGFAQMVRLLVAAEQQRQSGAVPGPQQGNA